MNRAEEHRFQIPWLRESNHSKLNETHSLIEQKSDNSLFDLGETNENEFNECVLRRKFKYRHLLDKLSIVKLDPISISPSTLNKTASHILNLKQEFTFPVSNFKSKNETGTQTLSLIESRVKTPYPTTTTMMRNNLEIDEPISRPQSDPTNHSSNHNLLVPRVTADIKPTFPTNFNDMHIGDGIEDNIKQIKFNAITLKHGDGQIEVDQKLPELSSPTFNCKKTFRPQTKLRQRKLNRVSNSSSSAESQNQIKATISTKKQNNYENNSDESDRSDSSGSHIQKLSTIVDQLQDNDWEVCHNALKNFAAIANSIYWNSSTCSRYIPIINRKLIDFSRSPRSNLRRTACQTAGEFFLLAKSTKRPEFDEMVDVLLSKSSDQNRFIQRDANVALDKMITAIPIEHSIRAICSKAPDNKNPMVRATAARLLVNICKQSGIEPIIGVQANVKTRKRVLSNLAKFLVDKNVETRRNSEKLCRLLKKHKFFNDYFFKDIENNMKMPLRRIINNIN